MILKLTVLISLLILQTIRVFSKCIHHCGSHHVQYPFGFSSGCKIPLNCTPQGQIHIGKFPIQSMNPDSILLTIQAKCDRPIHSIRQLFGPNYAPTSQNGILLHNCSSPASACSIPSTMVQTHFETLGCGSNSSGVSCYSGSNGSFISYENVANKKCKHFLSSISAQSFSSSEVSLEVQVVRLGWWLEGNCNCSKDASCVQAVSPVSGGPGFRCRCKEGFFGDGFNDGMGCRKVSSACNPEKYQCGGTTKIGALVGGIAAGASFIISLGLICFFIRRHSKGKIKHSMKRRLSEATVKCSIKVYSYKEIEKATESFSNKHRLGTGAYGTVYAGKLHDNEWVAIKRIKQREESMDQVLNEVRLLSSVSHPNLVRLIGCSVENDEQILVYEFMPNGTLCQHLQRERGEGLSWSIRLAIAAETAQAIAHLHSAMDPPIFHRDIKSSNILLDYNFRSKVADFGLSRLGRTEMSHISTAPQGTPGYLDPQYHQNFHLSDKSDVYSFGVVLMEIITAMKVVDFSRSQNEVNLANLATDRIGKDRLEEIIDPFLDTDRDEKTLSSVRKVGELAFRCLAFESETRPSMTEVAAELQHISLNRWPNSGGPNYLTSAQYFSGISSYSSSTTSSDVSEKPLSVTPENSELDRGLLVEQTEPVTIASIDSPCSSKGTLLNSVEDPWFSEQSSPSTNSLLRNLIR